MTQVSPIKTVQSVVKTSGFWLGVAGAALAAGAAYYLSKKEEIDFYLRLFGAKVVADKFYADYPLLTKNIAYGQAPTQRLDVYRPDTEPGHPVVIYIHGGSWYSGNKELYSPVAQRLMPEGIVTVVAGYTLYPQCTYRQQVTDAALAIGWVLDHIVEYGGDPRRVFVVAQSSGAHIGLLALLDPHWLRPTGHDLREIAGFIGISGVYDIEAQAEYGRSLGYVDDFMMKFFEGRENFAQSSPIGYVQPGLPPMLLIHGDADTVVPIEISESLHNAMLTAANKCTYVVYPKGGHVEIMFEALATSPARLVTDIVTFVKQDGAS